jgi:glycerol-3-phosphate dehydrogenase
MFSSALKKVLIPVVPAALLGGAYIGQQYWVNGRIGAAKMVNQPNFSLVPQHAKFVSQLRDNATFANNSTITTTPPTTVTPTGAEYQFKKPISRQEQINKLSQEDYDLLIIGGGISGVASANEASTRGFKVALVEKGDFGSCTSSRSTKLIHGGVRYLEQAFKTLDFGLIELVSEALHERSHMINAAPYMNEPLPIIIPLNQWWQVPYMGAGILMYDLFAAFEEFPRGYVISREECEKRFPQLDCDSLDLKAALVYFDGQMNDARHTLSLALTAEEHGANVTNYLEVVELHHDPTSGNLIGATVKDTLDPSSSPFKIKCKSILNAAGPYADNIRQMDDKNAPSLIVPSAGTHLVLPESVVPKDYGLLVPQTKDGRVVFLLPWEEGTIAGTTDRGADIEDVPTPTRADIKYIVDIVNDHVKDKITYDDVKSAWSGLRPLVKDPTKIGDATSKLSRNHLVLPTPTHMVSLMGGKFTTHRQMAQDAIDVVIKNNDTFAFASNEANDDKNTFKRQSTTFNKPIYGAIEADSLLQNDFNTLRPVLEQAYKFSAKSADYFARNYGTRALPIAQNAFKQCLQLHPETTNANSEVTLHEQCMLNAELDYVMAFEKAVRAEDAMFRRNRMGFTDTAVVEEKMPYVVDYMGKSLGWNDDRKAEEKKRVQYLFNRMDAKSIQSGEPLRDGIGNH